MKNIHIFSKLNKGYQLVKSWLLAGCYGLPILITTLLLTLGTGQMWGAELKEGQYIYINYSTSTWGSSSAKFKFNWYWNVGDYCCVDQEAGRVSGENYAYAQTQNEYTRAVQVLRFNSTYGTQWNYTNTIGVSSNTQNCITLTAAVSDNYSFSWTTYAPPMSTVTLSDNGTSIVSGSGASGDPYCVYVGATIKVSASGTKAVADPDATINYNFKQGSTSKQNGTSTTYQFTASSTPNTTYTLNLDGYTKVGSTSSTTKAATALYYKTIAVPVDPSVTLSASKASGINVGEAITLTATGNNASNITKYEFYEGSTKKGTVTTSNASAEYSYTPTTTGNKTVKVVMTYNSGSNTVTSSNVSLTLNTPSVSLAVKSGSATDIYLGETTTIMKATPSNVGGGVTPSYVFTDQAASPVSSSSQTSTEWTYTPGVTGAKTMKVTMTVGGSTYTATTTVNVYEHWNIYVQNNCAGWSGIYNYNWDASENKGLGNWPGTAASVYQGNWYTITFDSKYPNAILHGNNSEQTNDITATKGTYAPGTFWKFDYDHEWESTKYYNLSSVALSAPTVTLTTYNVISTTQIYVQGTITNYGNDGSSAADMQEVGFKIGENTYTTTCTSGDTFERYITGLTANTSYSVKAYATNIAGTGESAATAHTTRAAGTYTIKVRTGKNDPVPYIYAFVWSDGDCGGSNTTANAAYPGVAMTLDITGATYKWYSYTMSNVYSKFKISENSSNDTYDQDAPLADQCYWYDRSAAQASRIGTMACPYTTPQLMLETSPGSDAFEYYEMTGSGTISKARSLVAGTYKFKIVYNSEWYGKNDATITRAGSTTSTSVTDLAVETADMQIVADYAGDYTFNYNTSTNTVTVTYPTAYQITWGVGEVKGNKNTVTAKKYGTEEAVVSNSTWILSGNKVTFYAGANEPENVVKTGYTWRGYYGDAAGATSQLSNQTGYSPIINAAGLSFYACFYENDYTVTVTAGSNGSVASGSVTGHKDTKVTLPTATADQGFYFTGWTTTTGSVTYTNQSSATAAQVNGLTAAATVQANFTPKWSLTGSGTELSAWNTTANKFSSAFYQESSKWKGNQTITLAANTEYELKVYDLQSTPHWYGTNKDAAQVDVYYANGNESKDMSDTNNAAKNLHLHTAAGGSYTFKWNITDHALQIAYPTSWFITTGVNDVDGGSFTAVDGSSNDVYGGKFVANNATVTFTATPNTGYTFDGWYSNNTCTTAYTAGTNVAFSGAGNSIMTLSNITADKDVYAKFTPKTYTVTLTQTGAASAGTASVIATYNKTAPSIAVLPTAPNGYAFMGYYTATAGGGTQIIAANGSWNNVTGYTSDGKWVRDGALELFAYFQKAQITGISFSPAATVAPSATVTATPIISPTPVGPVIVCWRLLHNNGNIMDEQPTFTPGAGNSVSFTAPAASSTYLVACILRTGSVCGAGTVVDSATVLLQTAGDHTVTVQYKCGSATIKESTSLEGIKPLEWSDEITPPDIFGYTFEQWVAEDGVTISTNGTSAIDGSSTTTSTIYIKANYDGRLTAKYTQNNIIYFKDNLGWTDPADENAHIYVNLLTSDYWDNSLGSGNYNRANRNLQMNRVAGTTNIFYYDYGNKETSRFISFTKESMGNSGNFYQESPNVAHVVFPTRYSDDTEHDKATEGGFYAGTPMFVPLEGQTPVRKNSNRAEYYNSGYWTKYTPGTGYSLKIYNAAGNALIKDIPFTSEDELMPMTAVVDLEAGTTYKFELMREGDVYYGNDNSMTYTNHGQDTPWEMSWKEGGHKCGLTTNAAGEYIFHLTYSANAENEYRLRMSYDYPIATGDYRVIYKDNVHTAFKPSAIVPQVANGKDTVSFFIRPGQTPVMKIQQATVNSSTGAISWSAGTDITTSAGLTSLPQDSVYNICLQMNGSGAISVENVEAYTGNFYIRVDAANSKWDNYKNADHAMTYSEYSDKNSDYTHYWMAHTWAKGSGSGTNIKFVIANDYSPCISDTMIRSNYRGSDEDFVDEYGTITPEANIRFMWNRSDNTINRAYLSPAKKDGSQFLVLRGYNGGSGDKDDNLLSEADTELEGNPGETGTNNHAGGDHCMQFTDNENWIYEALVKVKPDTYVKLFARFAITINNETELPVTYTDLYYKGDSGDNFNGSDDDSDGIPNAIRLITGSGDHLLVRVIYDFKTDRLLAAYIPSGNITTEMNINADVMFIREHQGDISQITFSGSGAIKEIKTAYAVMRFNKWTLNNKSTAPGHAPLAVPLSRYERDLFYISFPFDVNLNEVFGFGQYGTHWIIEEYDGAGRAQKGFWQDSPTFWKFITNRNGKVLKKNVGYLLALDLDELGEDAEVWGVEENDRAELFFPSSGTMDDITSGSVTATLPEHTCTIVRDGADRRIADSHWNIMGVPTYVNTNNISFANTTWTTDPKDADAGRLGPKFLYTWNPDDNSLTATTASGFMYHAMHAYTVQYCGGVTWESSVSVTPSPIVSRERQAPRAYEWCLELQQNDQMTDRTYIRMSNEEEVTTGFEFGYDMSKDLNKNKANIYSFIGTEMVAGNAMPIQTEQTTIVPLGLNIKTAGDYTFAMPDGTNGVGVTLVDTEANIRTSLSALDYTVNLTTGQYDSRFILEISPVQEVITNIEPVSDSSLKGRAQKKMIDGILYIVRDGKIYDARGARIE